MEPNGWRVVSSTYTERFMPNGKFEPVTEVMIQADDGTYKTIIVPEGKFNREYVIAAGNLWIESHNSVSSIGN